MNLNKKILIFCILFLGLFAIGFTPSFAEEFEENFITDDSTDNGFVSEKPKAKKVSVERRESDDSAITGIRIETEDEEVEEVEKIELPKIMLSEIDEKDFTDIVVLQGLDKITAKISTFEVEVGESAEFKRLEIHPKKCWKSPPEENPENKVLLEIYENRLDGKREKLFYGWMFSSSPGLSSLEHPVYDITLIECRFSEDKEEVEKNKGKNNE